MKYQQIEKSIGIKFNNKNLLHQSLVHLSYLNEHPDFPLGSNERLEFLGDAVLEYVTSYLLYQKFPDQPEGNLTNIRSCLVRTTTLAEIARKLKLGNHLLLSRGEEDLGGRKNSTLLANSFEAVTGAIFLDQGIAKTKAFLLKLIKPKLEEIIASQQFKDPKSLFQEFIQGKVKITPQYKVIKAVSYTHLTLPTN